ncbi:MAG: orotidine-5'-phosphate decarboxylase [Betaproteobacteria bacterium]
MSFKAKMAEAAKNKDSKLVLALDFPFEPTINRKIILAKAQKVLKTVHPYVCAVKINHHLTLPLGLFDGVQTLVEQIKGQGMMAIMDAKVNDIGNTNQVIAEYYFAAGFDAIIANPFVGWEEGMKPLFEVAKRADRGVILLTYMSHRGAIEGYGQNTTDTETGANILQYVSFARKALAWGADGVVVGATVPQKIAEVKTILQGKADIYSPGVGTQGGAAEIAIKAGANYLIVGREIVNSPDPEKSATLLRNSIRRI